MPKDISLSELIRRRTAKEGERKKLSTEIEELSAIIATLLPFVHPSASVPKSEAKSSPVPHARRLEKKAKSSTVTTEAGLPTVRDALFQLLRAAPGTLVSEAISQLKGKTSSTASDPRKLISTRIGQLIRREFVRKEGKRLYLTEKAG